MRCIKIADLIEQIPGRCDRRVAAKRDSLDGSYQIARKSLGKEEAVRGRAHDQRGTAPVDQRYLRIRASQPVDKDCAFVQNLHSIKLGDFIPAAFVYAFRSMDYERLIGRRLPKHSL